VSKLIESIIARAKMRSKHIVLPEGEDKRIVSAAIAIVKDGIAKITLLGNKEKILADTEEGALAGIEIIDPLTSPKRREYADLLFRLRKEKGMTKERAEELVLDPMYYGCLMTKADDADGMVAGAMHSTGDLLRPAFQIIKARPGIKTVSSCFIMALPFGSIYGDNGAMVFGDCAVIPNPTTEQLVDIAVASADSATQIAGISYPRVAMLSFSTKGSALHEHTQKVIDATKILKTMSLQFDIDGELQLDAAIVPEVARLKAPTSTVAGRANVLVFPDLQSGNIGYKLAQRLGNIEAVGPICQGLNKPVNDLSRGCSVSDIISVVAITALQ